MRPSSQFKPSLWPYLFLIPQVLAILIFILWPAADALFESLFRGDAFGLQTHFVWLANFIAIFHDSTYVHSVITTLFFSVCVTVCSMGFALLMATMADNVLRGKAIYNTLMIWPYAVAPAIAGMLFRFLFNPSIGMIAYPLQQMGIHWNFAIDGSQALFLVILAAAWQQFSYNFIFFLAGLKSVPTSVLEAAALDGAGPGRRFWSMVFPLISPTTFFLVVMNLINAFFNTFGIIQVVTQGGPANATNILVYRVYRDGFVGLNFGSSAAQSVILMVIVTVLTIVQFKYVERKVHY